MMKKNIIKNICLALCIAGCSSGVFAASRGKQELIQAGHWIYDAFTAISLESRVRNFADSAPMSIQELESYFYDIDYDALSPAGKTQWRRIHDYFEEKNWSKDSDLFSLGVEPSINPEGYYKTNDDIDWVYDRYDRDSLIAVPVTFTAADWLTMAMDIHLDINDGQTLHDDTYCNVPLEATAVDVNFPDFGYMSTGYQFTDTCGVAFQLGILEQSIGRTSTGSIIVSDYMTHTTMGKLALYSKNLKYSFITTQLNAERYMYMHEFDMRFGNRLTFSVMEATLTNSAWEMRYLNPFTIYHGMAPWREYEYTDSVTKDTSNSDSHNCEYLGIKFDWAMARYVRLYGLFALNQYQVPYERSSFKNDKTPNSLGGQLGLESYIPAGEGYFHFNLEGYYANPYLYIKANPNWSLVSTHTDNIGHNEIFYEWVGSPFGPDTIAGELTLGYEKPGKWSLDTTYLFMVQGDNAEKTIFGDWSSTDGESDKWNRDLWPYPRSDNSHNQFSVTPTGTPKYTNRVSVRGTWQANQWLSFTLQPAFVYIVNNTGSSGFHESGNDDWGIECALAVKCKLTQIHN